MRQIALIFFAISLVLCVNAQDNPYEVFGHKTKVKYETNENDLLKVVNTDTSSYYKTLVFDYENRFVKLLDKDNKIIETILIKPNSTLRFISVDPHAQNYPSLSPYSFVGNMPTRAVDPDGRDIYILFATTGNKRGDAMFNAAMETRRRNIENSQFFDGTKDKVVVLHLTDISDIQNQVNNVVSTYSEQYGNTREVGVWSHGGMDGPVGTEAASSNPLYSAGETFRDIYREETSKQMSPEGWSQIDFNWTETGANFTLYGCNTGNDVDTKRGWVGSFARNTSAFQNFRNVQVSGQSTSAFPSFSPFIRSNNFARSAESFTKGLIPDYGYIVGDTYMVGGNKSQGLNSMWFTPSSYPRANAFQINQNGKKTGTGFQSTGSSTSVTKF